MCAVLFMCKHIVDNTYHIYRGMGVRRLVSLEFIVPFQYKYGYIRDKWGLERFQTANVTFKVIQEHWQWCHSIGHIRFPFSLPFQLCIYFALFTKYYYLFPKILRSHMTLNTSFS